MGVSPLGPASRTRKKASQDNLSLSFDAARGEKSRAARSRSLTPDPVVLFTRRGCDGSGYF